MVHQDEASLSNTASVSYAWGRRGKQPKTPQKQRKRERCTLFGCVQPKTGQVISMDAQRGNARTFFSFLLKVVRFYGSTKVYMVLDNVPYHHARILRPILERYRHRIELVFLPPYSPDLNSMERVWWYMRKKISHNRYLNTLEQRLQIFNDFIDPFKIPNDQGIKLTNLSIVI